VNGSDGDSSYRWIALGLAALTHALAVAVPMMCMPVLFQEISRELDLSLVEVGAIWGLTSMAGIASGVIGGSLGDRFGPRRTLSALCLLAGAAGGLRGFSSGFPSLALSVVLFGFLIWTIPANVHKTCGIWFQGRRLGLANGVASMGMASGFMLGSMISATTLSPWLGGWRPVLFLYGAIAMAMSLPWLLSRDKSAAPGSPRDEEPAPSPRRALSHVARIRNVWLFGFAILGIGGCVQGTLGYLPLYLRDIGWPEARADGALAAFHGVSMAFTLPLAWLSGRLASRKRVLMGAGIMTTLGVGLLSIAAGPAVWACVLLAGMVRDGFMAIFMTAIIETPGVGPRYAGTAMGLAMLFAGVAGLLAPPLGNALAATDPGLPFAFWAAMAVAGCTALSLVRSPTRPRASA